jgi:hypothetical protein
MRDAVNGAKDRLFAQAELHVVLILYNTSLCTFWGGVIAVGIGLRNAGYGGLIFVFVAAWLGISAPVLHAQTLTILDFLKRGWSGTSELVPWIIEVPDPEVISLLTRVIAGITSATSPLAGLSAVALYDLVPVGRPFALLPLKTRLETKVMAVAFSRR